MSGHPRPPLLGRLGLVAAAVVLAAGCGESSAPSDAVPALGDALDRVDDAIVDGRYDDARGELDGLVATTTDAQQSGDLEAPEADRILAAAAKVMSAMPAEEEPEPEPAPEEPPSDGDTGGDTGDAGDTDSGGDTGETDGDTGSDEEAEKEQEKEEEKLEEEQQKEEEKAEDEAGDEGEGNGQGD